ncbi:hypothetical protein ISS07_05195, partial [Candidatus Woesearchaeota archaeon]|nr:hypothetical protein [Candidatus Woesearchaeota archaeon]
MSEKNLVGLELELIVLDDSGKIVNRADEIINHPSNTGNILKESTLGVVEVISEPSSSLNELESLFTGELSQLQSITDSLGMYTAPISELGPQDALARREGSSRYSFSAAVLGTDNIGKLNSICGTHIHLDKEDNAVAQYNLMQSLDPVFVFLSTSPFLRGKNSFNSCRVQASRNEAFDAFPLHGQLLDYIPSLDYLDELNDLRLSTWMGGTSDPVQENIFDKYNTCWGPIRLRENTIEMRAS